MTTILALEFSAAERSVALARDGVVLSAARESGARATNAFRLISQVLAEAGVARTDVDTVAVGLGPGSYTGIRVGVSLALGWRLARPGVKLLGVDAITTLVAQAREQGMVGAVNFVIDAQRGEFYVATWELGAAEPRELTPLKIVPAAELAARTDEVFAGPDAARFGGTVIYPSAATVARLAQAGPRSGVTETLEPVYLRESTFVKWQPMPVPGLAELQPPP